MFLSFQTVYWNWYKRPVILNFSVVSEKMCRTFGTPHWNSNSEVWEIFMDSLIGLNMEIPQDTLSRVMSDKQTPYGQLPQPLPSFISTTWWY